MSLCHICGEKEATKTNSHLIPSFLVTPVCSYNQSGRRDSELMFTITSNGQNVYTGRDVPLEKYEEVFDTTKLTDERIENELKNNHATLDNIFCPSCEERLSKRLESPYSQCLRAKKSAEGDIAYMFWLSVFWRVSRFNQFNFRFTESKENEMRKALYDYFISKESGEKADGVIESCSFQYQIVEDEIETPIEERAIIGCYKDDVAFMMFGSYAVCASFEDVDPKNVGYCGFEDLFCDASINNGNGREQIQRIKHNVYLGSIDRYKQYYTQFFLEEEFSKLDLIWNKLELSGQMPMYLKLAYIQKLYDDEVKIGDRLLPERKVRILRELLSIYKLIDVFFPSHT